MRLNFLSVIRYTVYYTPPTDSALWALGSAWLGRDSASGELLSPPELPGISRQQIDALTLDSRRYGLHGTLKAPFRLADGCDAAALDAALQALVARFKPVPMQLQVGELHGFIALRPLEDSAAIRDIAAACVEALDHFRAPPTDADIARRKPNQLSSRQRDYLLCWGYPYVMDEHRLHLTLTRTLADEERAALLPALMATLRAHFAQAAQAVQHFDAISLFHEREGQPMRLVKRYPF